MIHAIHYWMIYYTVIKHPFLESKCHSSPQAFREFLSELSCNTPVCGLLQVAGNDEVLAIIDAIASGVDITQPSRREKLKLLQEHAPVLASFIIKCFYGQSLPADVRSLIQYLKELTVAPFEDGGMNHPKMDASLQCNKSSNNGWHESSKNGCFFTV